MSAYRVCVLPGDGIGPEVITQALAVLAVLPVQIETQVGAIGWGAYQQYGTPLPDETLQKVHWAQAVLFGAVTTPPHIPGYSSPILRLRRELDLYANLRPCRSFPAAFSRPGVDLLVVRENTEGLYSGIERVDPAGERAVTERVITRRGSERIVRKAFQLAQTAGYQKVTVVHKANVLRETCGLFRQTALQVAQEFPGIQVEEMLVDTCAMELVRAPQQFQVIVTTNLFGDILSDAAGMLVGGLGLAASGNIGAERAVFEPVHGSAPKLAGTGRANPMAAFLSTVLLLEYLGERRLAHNLSAAVLRCIETGRVTEDLGGHLTTRQVTEQVIEFLEKG